MLQRIIYLLLAVFLSIHICYGQIIDLDSCGIDMNPLLNKYEINYFKNVLFLEHPDSKNFDFKDKKLAFYNCNEGFLAKNKYFELLKKSYIRPRGINFLIDVQKRKLGGYDAIIIIDCKASNDSALLANFQQWLQSK
jgi:hypothetical protein